MNRSGIRLSPSLLAVGCTVAFLTMGPASSLGATTPDDRPALRTAQSSARGEKEGPCSAKVSLFGTPCTLSGPCPESSLTAVHAISPEQIPPAEDLAQARKSIDRLKKNGTPFPELASYQETALRRLQAQATFFQSFAEARRTGKVAPLLENVRPHLLDRRAKDFEAFLRKSESRLQQDSFQSAALTVFNECITPDPEEDFHRAIRRLKIRYFCSFEENKDSDAN